MRKNKDANLAYLHDFQKKRAMNILQITYTEFKVIVLVGQPFTIYK